MLLQEGTVKTTECYTAELYAIADWLSECGVETVAMESTGVYWIALFQILETRGFEVKLVNAHHVKTLPGRKTDVLDCQWLQQLHSYGLLSGSFRPEEEICVLRSYIKSSQTRPVVNRAANAFRMAAQTAGKSNSALGAFYRRLHSRLGSPKAITATAHKIARIFYKLWTTGRDYTDPGMDYY